MRKTKVAIVGGGYIGTALAKSLDDVMDVTVVERASHFTHAPAMIRAMIETKILDRALIPYDQLLSNGQVLRGEAVAVDGTGVTLADGGRVAADYIVLATGSANLAPFKSETGDIAGLRANVRRWHDALMAAQSVLIIGAGAVGTELAGEIAHSLPDKTVTLVSSDNALFPGKSRKLGRSLKTKLEAMGVNIMMGQRADSLPGRGAPEGGSVTLSGGQVVTADLIIPAVGSRPLTFLAAGLPGAEISKGRVIVDRWLRPSTLPNVFVAGDIAQSGDNMTIVATVRQKPWLEKTLTSLAGGKPIDDIKPYKPWGKAPIILPLGPKKGSAFLVAFTAGNWVTRRLKGKDMFLTRYNKLLGRV
ncbi:MAG: FAD-dependent oxidoreductase [Pseudomonadota bacterium]